MVGVVGGVLWLAGFDQVARWAFAVFAIAVAAIDAWGMVKQLRRRQFGIDILAVIAIVATVAVGEVIASMIIVLMVAGGKALEDYAQGRAQRELTALLDREPQTAHRLLPGIAPRSRRSPRPRCASATCCSCARARSSPSTAAPIRRARRSTSRRSPARASRRARLRATQVLSGSVNGNASAVIVATALAADSQYQAIVGLVKQASTQPGTRRAARRPIRDPVHRRLAAHRGVAWAVSGDPVRFAEVLVLATPCPLVLAAPVAFMGGMSRAARNGIIVKGGGVLELLARVRTAVFDKTGTLTLGGAEHVESLRPRAVRRERAATAGRVRRAAVVARARGLDRRGGASAGAHRCSTPSELEESPPKACARRSATARRRRDARVRAGHRADAPAPAAISPAASSRSTSLSTARSRAAIIATDRSAPTRSRRSPACATWESPSHHAHRRRPGHRRARRAPVGITEVRADCLPADKVDAVRDRATAARC